MGFDEFSHTHRLMVSSCAERSVCRTMGYERERIGVAFALEADGLQLCEAFDVGAVLRENADALDEVDERSGAGWAVEGFLAGDEAQPGDLVRAGADGEAERRFVVDERHFEGDAGFGVGCEFVERVVIEDDVEHHSDAVAQRCDALAHGVQWEEVAQDDPEPFHVLSMESGFGPAESRRLRPTNRVTRPLRLQERPESFPTGLRRLFPRVFGPRARPRPSTGSG